ncbi:MAG TPA: hypothetical protein DCQ31_13345 [Bacteroidales bacterium]|nr:hypothetical protein [Bacteroidales bacterium]
MDAEIDLAAISEEYEVTGASIVNILKYCAIKSVERPDKKIMKDDLVFGIRREIMKEGKFS